MKILITTGLSKSDIGGPFQYGENLKNEFEKLGHEVRMQQYSSVEKALFKIWPDAVWAEKILALDTFSVGLPSVVASRLLGRKIIIRIGGDFLWSAYVNRTGEPISLPVFYKNLPEFNFKEKIIFMLTSWLVKKADFLAFNTEWQRNIWANYYKIKEVKTGILRNYIPEKSEASDPEQKNFVWAGRLIPEKNIPMLKKLGVEIITGKPHEKIQEKLQASYAAVSLAFSDICPNFILEAISWDKPFVMTKETGLHELVPRGGIFVNPFDEEEIRKAFEALRDEKIYNNYANELKSLTLSHTWTQMAEQIISLWRKI